MLTIHYISTGHQDIQYGWQRTPNSAGGVSVKISFRNDYQKAIKYVVFVTQPYNAVNDPVASQYSHQNGRLKMTGPVNPGQTQRDVFWENCWYNHSIVGAKILSAEIIFMDGTSTVVQGSQLNYEQLKGGCYVATAVYGSYDCPQVWTLRRYRDNTLAKSWYGRAFIRTYYAVSPTLVKWFGHTEWFKKMWKGKLDKMVAQLRADGVEDTPYEDRSW